MKRPKMIWFNGLLTLFVIGLLCFTKILCTAPSCSVWLWP